MKNENEAIRKLIVPLLKKGYFVRTSVRVDRLHQKLKTEEVLSPEEISIKHPFHPDIDILFWAKEYSGEPKITGAEVKYFRLKNKDVYPTIYEGLGEAMMLLTFGLDHVCLWHLFDSEIDSETLSRYRDLTQNLTSATNMPINYQSSVLPTSTQLDGTIKPIDKLALRTSLIPLLPVFLKENPLMNRWDTKIMRSIIKKGYRIVNK